MQRKIPTLKLDDVLIANAYLEQLKDSSPTIGFNKHKSLVQSAKIVFNRTSADSKNKIFLDAAFIIRDTQRYTQAGFKTELHICTQNEQSICRLIDRTSCNQRRVSILFYGSNILVCAAARDRW